MTPHDDANTTQDRGLPLDEGAPTGLQRGLVRLVPYDAAWDRIFANEAAAVRAVLGDRVLGIEHVGSTAVEGMTAKPILDIVVAIPRFADGPGLVAALVGIGYEDIPHDPVLDREFLVKGPLGTRQIRLSLTEIGSACWRSHVLLARSEPRTVGEVYGGCRWDVAGFGRTMECADNARPPNQYQGAQHGDLRPTCHDNVDLSEMKRISINPAARSNIRNFTDCLSRSGLPVYEPVEKPTAVHSRAFARGTDLTCRRWGSLP